jgi:predicted phage-related endonuclease
MEPLCLVHERLDWMRASLDGLSFDGSIVLEIKCPINLRDRNAAAQGWVPNHYYSQLQHQLEVSGADEAHYWSFDGRAGCLVKIRPDRDHMKRLVDAEGEFWRRVEENRWPEIDDGDLDLAANPQWRSLAVQYRKVRTQFEKLSLEERRLRTLLDRLATSRRTFGCGVEVLKSLRRGAVDYAQVPELRGVDLERYRKVPIPVMVVNFFELSADSV